MAGLCEGSGFRVVLPEVYRDYTHSITNCSRPIHTLHRKGTSLLTSGRSCAKAPFQIADPHTWKHLSRIQHQLQAEGVILTVMKPHYGPRWKGCLASHPLFRHGATTPSNLHTQRQISYLHTLNPIHLTIETICTNQENFRTTSMRSILWK